MRFWRRPARDSSQPTPICSMMKVTEVRACPFKFPQLAEVETSPSPWGLDVASQVQTS